MSQTSAARRRKTTSKVQPSKPVSKKQKRHTDNQSTVETSGADKLASVIRGTKLSNSSSETVMKGKGCFQEKALAQGKDQSSPKSEKHTADVPNATKILDTVKEEEEAPVLFLTDKKFSAKRNIPSDMVHYIKQKGRDFNKVKEHLQSIRLEVKERYFQENGNVWVGYEPKNKNIPVFVAEVEKRNCYAPEMVYGCSVYQRVEEEEAVSSAEGNISKGKKTFSEKEIISLCNCMERNTDRWLKSHSNIVAVMGSDKILHENQKVIEDKTSVVIYVRIKGIIPFYEEPFVLDNNDFPLDVREGRGVTLVSSLSPKEYSKSIRIGCKIETAYGSGTLTGFLQLHNGKIGCLTAWHLFDTGEKAHTAKLLDSDDFDKNVYQPNQHLNEKYKIGKVIDVSETFDAALIEIDNPDRLPRNGNFPNVKGFPPSNPMKFDSGDIIRKLKKLISKTSCTVVKYGAVTKATFGNIYEFGEYYRLELQNGRECRLRKPISVVTEFGKPFCDKGDSGALVFIQDDEIDNKKQEDDENNGRKDNTFENDYDMKEDDRKDDKKKKLRAFGMLVGNLERNENGFVVMPIWEILKSFNLPLRLLSFEEPWNIGFDQLQEQLKEVNANLNTVGQQLAQNTDITRKTYEAVTKFINQNTNQKK